MDYNFYFCWTEHLRFILVLQSLFDIKEKKEAGWRNTVLKLRNFTFILKKFVKTAYTVI